MQLRKRLKKVHGIGINDADYRVAIKVPTDSGWTTQMCPFYSRWSSIFARCYSPKKLAKWPTYAGCTVAEEWHIFSRFRMWMDSQDWEGMHLDKDILFPGNKIYSPETCVFVTAEVNAFVNENQGSRGKWPLGVNFHKKTYQARCMDVTQRKEIHIGTYQCPNQAHKAWLAYKLSQAKVLAARQEDLRVAHALVARYENWKP